MIDNFLNNNETVRERKIRLRENQQILREAREGTWLPQFKLSEFYKEIAPAICDKDWPYLREAIINMMRLEEQIFNPSFNLRENKNRLLEEYARISLFEDSNHLQERKLVRKSDESDEDYFGRERARKDRENDAAYIRRKLKKDTPGDDIRSGLQKRRDDRANRPAETPIEQKLDNDREMGKIEIESIPETEELEAMTIPEIEKTAQDIARELQSKILHGQVTYKQASQELADTIKPAGKKGGFLKGLLGKIGGVVAKIAKPLAYGASMFKFGAMFAPFGPPGILLGAVTGIVVAHFMLKFGKYGAEKGGQLGEKAYDTIIEALQNSKNKIAQWILKKLQSSDKGKIFLKTFASILGGVALGGGFMMGASAALQAGVSSLAGAFAAAIPEAAEIVASSSDAISAAEAEAMNSIETLTAQTQPPSTVHNSIAAQAEANVGDVITRTDGTQVQLTQADINWAQQRISPHQIISQGGDISPAQLESICGNLVADGLQSDAVYDIVPKCLDVIEQQVAAGAGTEEINNAIIEIAEQNGLDPNEAQIIVAELVPDITPPGMEPIKTIIDPYETYQLNQICQKYGVELNDEALKNIADIGENLANGQVIPDNVIADEIARQGVNQQVAQQAANEINFVSDGNGNLAIQSPDGFNSMNNPRPGTIGHEVATSGQPTTVNLPTARGNEDILVLPNETGGFYTARPMTIDGVEMFVRDGNAYNEAGQQIGRVVSFDAGRGQEFKYFPNAPEVAEAAAPARRGLGNIFRRNRA